MLCSKVSKSCINSFNTRYEDCYGIIYVSCVKISQVYMYWYFLCSSIVSLTCIHLTIAMCMPLYGAMWSCMPLFVGMLCSKVSKSCINSFNTRYEDCYGIIYVSCVKISQVYMYWYFLCSSIVSLTCIHLTIAICMPIMDLNFKVHNSSRTKFWRDACVVVVT